MAETWGNLNPVRLRWITVIYIIICVTAFLLSSLVLLGFDGPGRPRGGLPIWAETDAELIGWLVRLFAEVTLWLVGVFLFLRLTGKHARTHFGLVHHAVICVYGCGGLVLILSTMVNFGGGCSAAYVVVWSDAEGLLGMLYGVGFMGSWILPMALGVGMLGEWLRRRSRIKHNLCLECAYDLRGLDREKGCPECGWNRVVKEDGKGSEDEVRENLSAMEGDAAESANNT